MDAKTRNIIALLVIGLYLIVVLSLLVWNMVSEAGDMGLFFDHLNKANFLLGPVGFVMGYYFKKDKEE
ncbi:hypothetical protein [Halomonas ramblicola]|uniref:hypothetical protein n=1 Tax=Halomonas ramblicola TaxID=747349 RepID=UPI0025B322EC|nr:hypothetical protein [Halomonas ramblicola]MDN3521151.1 hypothetical protein [Halomonas ramblicola]